MIEAGWNNEAYWKQKRIAERITDKGIRIALNQAVALTDEAKEAYLDVLRERGWTDQDIRVTGING